MKTIKIYILTLVLIVVANMLFAQTPVKQYCGGNNGTIQSPAHALGNDLSDCSTLKLKTPFAKNNYVYQNFVFAPESVKDCRVVFVIQTNEDFSLNSDAMNLKFYTTANDKVTADTLNLTEVQISKVNIGVGLYEFSFVANRKFDTAGILLQGGGILKMAKIYKVYMAVNNAQAAPFAIVTAKK